MDELLEMLRRGSVLVHVKPAHSVSLIGCEAKQLSLIFSYEFQHRRDDPSTEPALDIIVGEFGITGTAQAGVIDKQLTYIDQRCEVPWSSVIRVEGRREWNKKVEWRPGSGLRELGGYITTEEDL